MSNTRTRIVRHWRVRVDFVLLKEAADMINAEIGHLNTQGLH